MEFGGARGVMFIVVGNGHGDTSCKIVGQTRFFSLGEATSLGEEKL